PPSGTNILVPNSLGDLTKRECRFAHYPTNGAAAYLYGFPYDLSSTVPVTGYPNTNAAYLMPLSGNRQGDDVLLTNVLSFDVQIYDPGAPTFVSNGVAITPNDAGYAALLPGGASAAAGFGAYVDPGYAPSYTVPNPPPVYPTPLFNLAANAVASG